MAVKLPGEAHAAMHLDVVLGAELEGLGGADAGRGGGLGQFGVVRRQRPGGPVGVGAGERAGHVHVGEHVLDRLERADLAPEGEALQGVVACHFQRPVGAAELLEGGQHRCAVQHVRDDAVPFTGRAERFGGGGREADRGVVAGGVDRGHGFACDAGAGEIDDMQALAVAGAGGDHGEIGDGAIGHRGLGAGQGSGGDLGLDRARRDGAGAFGIGEGADPFPRRQLRQVLPLLCLAAGRHQQLGGEIDGRGYRHRGQRAPEFLGDHALLQMADAEAAIFLGDGGAEPAEPGHVAPDRCVEAGLALEHGPYRGRRAFIGEEPAGLLLELLLVFGEIEIHGFAPRGLALRLPMGRFSHHRS